MQLVYYINVYLCIGKASVWEGCTEITSWNEIKNHVEAKLSINPMLKNDIKKKPESTHVNLPKLNHEMKITPKKKNKL